MSKYYVFTGSCYSGIYLDEKEFQSAKSGNTIYSEDMFDNYKEAERFLRKEYNGEIKKYYAVKTGRIRGIVLNWAECETLVSGYVGAKYKSFTDVSGAIVFITGEPIAELYSRQAKTKAAPENVKPYAYVDGSYNSHNKKYGYGVVLDALGERHEFSDSGNDPRFQPMRNVSGEIFGSMRAVTEAINLGLKELTIFYDYEGIKKWATGEWQCNKEGTQMYSKFISEARPKLKINFVKVKAHTGVELNEKVDLLAKKAVGLLK